MVTKLFEQPELIESQDAFAVYAGVDCNAIGMPDADTVARARRRLEYIEGVQVDLHMQAVLSTISDPLTSGDVGTMIAEADLISRMEYGGYATILLSVDLAVHAAAGQYVFRAPDGGLETVNGTRVAGIAWDPAISAENFFLTGQITMIQGPIQDHIVPETMLPDGTCVGRRALAERIYVPLIDCLAYAGIATVPSP
jgi:hypothetical protein